MTPSRVPSFDRPLRDLAPGRDQYLRVARDSYEYFLQNSDSKTGLVADSTRDAAPSSITGVGFALAGLPCAVEAGWLDRKESVMRALRPLRFFHDAPQDGGRDGTGYRGFYYHFLDSSTGRRARESELSTIDTTLLIAGALTAAEYFDGDSAGEREIRDLTEVLYRRIEWDWALNAPCHGTPADTDAISAVSMGWTPERGFLRARWEGYNEGLLLYVLALGSPTHPIPPESYQAFTRTYCWKKVYDIEYLYAGPLFIHQYPHLWIDFRDIQDAYMKEKGIDYFLNSRRACYVQHAYAVRNPRGFAGYAENLWGVTASDGPGPGSRTVRGKRRHFWDYCARGVPYGPDDGTLAAWAVLASLPFAPELVKETLDRLADLHVDSYGPFGFTNSFNPSWSADPKGRGWVSPWHYALNQGPIVLAVENYESGLIWRLMRSCPYLRTGLLRAGFRGGWVEGEGRRNIHQQDDLVAHQLPAGSGGAHD